MDEFHSPDFYRGNGVWRGTDGVKRAQIIEAVLNWVEMRKHKCVFSGINKAEYKNVPFFADSKHVLLAQVADLFAYLLRTSAEIKDGLLQEKYKDEGAKIRTWSNRIAGVALLRSSRYPAKGRCQAAQLFWDLAPSTIRELE